MGLDRLWFEEIDSVGAFPDDRIKMDVRFQDNSGNEYVWTPRWKEIMDIFAEAERVEEINVDGGEWLDDLTDQKQFHDEVLTDVSKIIGDTRTGREITDFFRSAGFPDIQHDGSTKWRFVREQLRQLNEDDYRDVLQVVQKLADPKQYINEEGEHQAIIDRLNQALVHENLKVTSDGKIKPVPHEDPAQDSQET